MGIQYGAGDVTRTHDLLITNQLHYRLCYTSIFAKAILIVAQKKYFVNIIFKIIKNIFW